MGFAKDFDRGQISPTRIAAGAMLLAVGCTGRIGAANGTGGPASSGGPGGVSPAGGTTTSTPEGTVIAPDGTEKPALPPESGGSSIDNARIFNCGPTDNGASPERLWRLTGAQYTTTIAALFGGRKKSAAEDPKLFLDLAPPFVIVAPDRFTTYSYSYSMSDNEFRRVIDDAGYIAENYGGDNHNCVQGAAKMPSDDCLQQFGEILFRRPLNNDELVHYKDIAQQATDMNLPNAGSLALEAMLVAPQFLYRVEIGSKDASGLQKLDPYEIATAISYGLENAPPDQALWDAAKAGALSNADEVDAHVRRILPTVSLSKAGRVMQFMQEYFTYPKAAAVFKDGMGIKVGWNPGDLINDTNAFVGSVLDEHGTKEFLKTILTTNVGYFNSYTVDNYNIVSASKDRAPQRTTFPVNERAGILTQPSFLTGYSSANENKPVQRGKYISESLLCRPTPSLPIGMIPKLTDLGPNATLRDRMALHTKAAGCLACHHLTDPIGLAFETYDHYGRFIATDGGRPADGSGALTDSGNQDGSFSTPIELVTKLASSTVVEQCFVRHSFRYWMGRNELEADACTMAQAREAYQKGGGNYVDMVAKLFTSPSFFYRLPN